MNERLRDALNKAGLRPTDVATELQVSPKTVERWVTQSRTPYARHRSSVAVLVRESENYLWPDIHDRQRRLDASDSELVRLYHHRSQVTNDLWRRLIKNATERIDILVYAGLFLPEQQPKLAKQLCAKAKAGATVRVLLGDPKGHEVAQRGSEEGIDEAMAAKVTNAMTFYEDHAKGGCFEVRLHRTVLYNSVYRFDNDMLVNTHVLGVAAAHAPVLHLRQLPGGEMFDMYAGSVDEVWQGAVPAWPAEGS